MSYSVVPTVNIIITSGDKILLSRRQNTGWKDGWLVIPGGHVEEGETPRLAVLREIKEELGVTVRPEDIEFLCSVLRNIQPLPHAAFVFTMDVGEYRFENAEPEKCSELVWVDPEELPDDVVEDFRVVIEECHKGKKKYLEVGYKLT